MVPAFKKGHNVNLSEEKKYMEFDQEDELNHSIE